MNSTISVSRRTLILSCSPREGGNSDVASRLVSEEFASLRPNAPHVVRRLADFRVRPCMACDFCLGHPGLCSMDGQDEAGLLLSSLCAPSPLLPVNVLVSPIHFYHLPARLKSLLDRSQSSWRLPPEERPGHGAKLAVILLAARERGDKLFEGSLLTLRHVALALGLELVEPLTLYGLDEPDALSCNGKARERVQQYARSLLADTATA